MSTTAQSISLWVNGEPVKKNGGLTVCQLVHEMQLEGKRIAVELNEEIIPRSQHDQVLLKDGDIVEVVTAIGGG